MWMKMNVNYRPDLITTLESPKDLTLAIQELLITCWWTGCLVALAPKYLLFFLTIAKAVRITNAAEKENTLASNLLSLLAER
jgi:hypothetical protein